MFLLKNHQVFVILSILVFYTLPIAECGIYQLITEALQNNVAGEPILHKTTTWDFNPEDSQKRRSLFYETNGFRAAHYIERIGLGLDGREQERRIVQGERDVGRLNGEHNINYPVNTV